MTAYWDTSALASLYLADIHSHAAAAAMAKSTGPVLITGFHELEFANAVQLRLFRHELAPAEAAAVSAAFASDRTSRFAAALVSAAAFTAAAHLARLYTAKYGVRSLDLLHLASAIELQAELFVSFDRRQLRLAHALGLRSL